MTDQTDTPCAAPRDCKHGQLARSCNICELERDQELLNHGCIIEVAIRNPSVADHMKHWEDRAVKAESEIAAALREEAECERALAAAKERVAVVTEALDESVSLQTHYAMLLNMHDDGLRKGFANADEWIARLDAVKKQLSQREQRIAASTAAPETEARAPQPSDQRQGDGEYPATTPVSAAPEPEAAQSFGAWLENPYTKSLLKSIKDGYVPRFEIAAPATGVPLVTGDPPINRIMPMPEGSIKVTWTDGLKVSTDYTLTTPGFAPTNFTAAPEPEASSAQDTIDKIADIFRIGKDARVPSTLLANIVNAIRRANCLSAVEHEFFTKMVKAEDDEGDEDGLTEECPLNWGAEPKEYVEQFRTALASVLPNAGTPTGEQSITRTDSNESPVVERPAEPAPVKVCTYDSKPCPLPIHGRGKGNSQCEQNGVCQRVNFDSLPRLQINIKQPAERLAEPAPGSVTNALPPEPEILELWGKFAVSGNPQGLFMLYPGFRDAIRAAAEKPPPQPTLPPPPQLLNCGGTEERWHVDRKDYDTLRAEHAKALEQIQMLQRENAALERKAELFHEEYRRECDTETKALAIQVEELKAEVERKHQALVNYGQHLRSCASMTYFTTEPPLGRPCNCGLSDAITARKEG